MISRVGIATALVALAALAQTARAGITSLTFGGRIDNLEGPTNIHFDWSGVSLTLGFSVASTATSGSVSLSLTDDGNLFNVFLDGATTPTTIVQTTANGGQPAAYVLASGLAPGSAHTMLITKRTEPDTGITIFHGFAFADLPPRATEPVVTEFVSAAECAELHRLHTAKFEAAVAAGAAAAPKKLEFYGDSITCGYGNEGVPPCPFTPQTENNWLSWGPVAGRALGATVNVEAWSGKGVVRNYGDKNTTSVDPMPAYWNQSVANTAPSRWNFARYVPDAVVVNLGTNDYSTQPVPPDAVFVAGYLALVADIQAAYAPATPQLVLVCGPLYTVPAHCTNVQAVAAQVNATFVDLNGVLGAGDYGCNGHPSVSGHAKMAAAIVPVLSKLLGL